MFDVDRRLLSLIVTGKMKKDGLTIRQAARESGVSTATIQRAMIDGDVRHLTKFLQVCNWVGIDPAVLFIEERKSNEG